LDHIEYEIDMKLMKHVEIVWAVVLLATALPHFCHAEVPSAADYRKVMMPLVGEWSLAAGGGQGTMNCKLGSTGLCLVSSVDVPGGPSADIFEGYDPELKSWKKIYFWSHGGTTTILLKLQTQESGSSRILEGTARDIDALGSVRVTDVKYVMEEPNSWRIQRGDGTTIVFKRKSASN
jgi:hypothetical protein